MIMVQPEAEVWDETVPVSADVCLPLTLTIGEHGPVRILFFHVDRP
jgi:hypothetical protein